MSQKTFVCDDCGLKFDYEDISVNEVSICKSCSEEEIDTVKKLMDLYRDVGMSPSDFMQYTYVKVNPTAKLVKVSRVEGEICR